MHMLIYQFSHMKQ